MGFFSRAVKKQEPAPALRAILFDTFGTTVDWYSGMVAHGEKIGAETGVKADWEGVAREWRAHYKQAFKPVREGKRRWTGFDELHREELDKIVKRFGARKLRSADRDRLTQGWHELKPWPDVSEALYRLKEQFLIAPLSNGTTRQLVDLARYGNLPWDAVFGADLFRTYKPAPAVYTGAVAYLGLKPAEVLMVAAHNEDLKAAQKQGLRTCFVHRATEDQAVEGSFDYAVHDFEELARALGVDHGKR